MIVVRLLGGLGNQLFQYAAARRLALATGVPLKLDVSAFESYDLRKYELDHFRVVAELASRGEIESLRRHRLFTLGARLVGRSFHGPHVDEPTFEYDSRLLGVRPPAYLTGYWQSERYFADVADVLRSELTLRAPVSPETATVETAIRSVPSISIHVRRGDYVSNARTNGTHGTCSADYYRAAVAEARRIVPDGHFFVFSDDPAWVKANLPIDAPHTFVDHNGAERAHEDLHLIGRCRHQIIANSTFSWWGAWLAESPSQVVIAPRQWFAVRNERAKDVCPERWIRL